MSVRREEIRWDEIVAADKGKKKQKKEGILKLLVVCRKNRL